MMFELSFDIVNLWYSNETIHVKQEKAPYVAEAEKRKETYERNMEAYNKKLVIDCYSLIVTICLYANVYSIV